MPRRIRQAKALTVLALASGLALHAQTAPAAAPQQPGQELPQAGPNSGYTLTINAAPGITTTSLPPWTVSQPYSQALASTGGTSPVAIGVSAGTVKCS